MHTLCTIYMSNYIQYIGAYLQFNNKNNALQLAHIWDGGIYGNEQTNRRRVTG